MASLIQSSRVSTLARVRPRPPVCSWDVICGDCRGEWTEVDLDNLVLRLNASKIKTKRGRLVDLAITPSLVTMLENRPRTGRYVFGDDHPVPDLRYYYRKLPFDGVLADYAYDGLLEAKQKGLLDKVLKSSLAEQYYGSMRSMPKGLAERLGFPDSDDLMDD